mmetsp:Transcript_44296/g.84692  ORF Transcript_44296/g.84692 Transcript_44296/m.84692 type:complete len:229 (+) Transcript_44296:531-1217(+)
MERPWRVQIVPVAAAQGARQRPRPHQGRYAHAHRLGRRHRGRVGLSERAVGVLRMDGRVGGVFVLPPADRPQLPREVVGRDRRRNHARLRRCRRGDWGVEFDAANQPVQAPRAQGHCHLHRPVPEAHLFRVRGLNHPVVSPGRRRGGVHVDVPLGRALPCSLPGSNSVGVRRRRWSSNCLERGRPGVPLPHAHLRRAQRFSARGCLVLELSNRVVCVPGPEHETMARH